MRLIVDHGAISPGRWRRGWKHLGPRVGAVAIDPQIVVIPHGRRVDAAEEHEDLARAVVDEVVALPGGRTHCGIHLGPGVRGETVRPGVAGGRPAVSSADASAEENEDIVLTVIRHRVRELGQAGPRSGGLQCDHLDPAPRFGIEGPRVISALAPEHHYGCVASGVGHRRAQPVAGRRTRVPPMWPGQTSPAVGGDGIAERPAPTLGIEEVLTAGNCEERAREGESLRERVVRGDIGCRPVDGDGPVLVIVERACQKSLIDDDAGSGAESCHARRARAPSPVAAKHPEELIDRVILEPILASARGWLEIPRTTLMRLDLHPAIGRTVILPDIVLTLGWPATEEDGPRIGGVKRRANPAAGPTRGICFLSPNGRPALAFRGGCDEKERGEPNGEGEEEGANQDAAGLKDPEEGEPAQVRLGCKQDDLPRYGRPPFPWRVFSPFLR